MNETKPSRREVMSLVAMIAGLLLSYGLFAVQGLLFLIPRRLAPRTRRIFAGQIDQFEVGAIKSVFDLQGNEILITRNAKELRAYNSTCPHLGCRVHWESDRKRFFCPCHNGVFDENGVAIEGPPAAAGQNLATLPLEVDPRSGVVYLEIKDSRKKLA